MTISEHKLERSDFAIGIDPPPNNNTNFRSLPAADALTTTDEVEEK